MNLDIRVDPAEITLRPAEEVTVTVSVVNTSARVEHYGLHLRGLPHGCMAATNPEVVMLHPGQTGILQLTLSADVERPPLAGRIVLGVTAASPYRAEVTRTAELAMISPPVPELDARVDPEVLTNGSSEAQVEIVNQGNTRLDIELSGRDPEGRARLRFDTPRLVLPARGMANVRVRIHARRPLTGAEMRRQLTVQVRSQADPVDHSLTYVQKPLIPNGTPRVLASAVALAVMATTLGVGVRTVANLVSKANGQSANGGASTTTPPSGNSSPPTSSPPGSSPPTSSPPGSSPPTSSPPGSSPPTPTAGSPVSIDLTTPPPGRPNVSQNLLPSAYPGLVMSAIPDRVRPECANITTASYLKLEDGRRVVAAGTFTRDTTGKGSSLCSDLPLRIELAQPAEMVTVRVLGHSLLKVPASTAEYQLREDPDGTPITTRIALGQEVDLVLADSGAAGITAVVLSGEPANNDIGTFITSISTIPVR